MKKLFSYAMMSAAALTMATSCSQDVSDPAMHDDGNVRFTVCLPGNLETRAFGDGLDATSLTYAVYQVETDGDNKTYTQVGDANSSNVFSSLKTNVSLKLVTGKTYKVVFWAQNPDTEAFTLAWGDQPTVKVNYEKMQSNSETNDAFYAVEEFQVTGAQDRTVNLYRPFAQINFGTDDMNEAAVTNAFPNGLTTTLTIPSVHTTFDFLAGEATDETVAVSFTSTSQPAAGDYAQSPFPMEGDKELYSYLSMDYILVPVGGDGQSKSSLIDCTYDIKATGTDGAEPETLNSLTIPNVPVQANFRTNIYGQLLTSTQNFNVVIVPDFEKPDFNVNKNTWDGSVETPEITDNLIEIDTPSQFAGLAKLVNDGNDLNGVTINLNLDIDFDGRTFTPLGDLPYVGTSKPFKGTLNGNGHVLKNLNINANCAGIVGYAKGPAKISDLTVENSTIKGSRFSGGIVALLHLDENESPVNPSVENATVRNCTVTGNKKCGGITGFFQSNILISDCLVEDCNITATKEVGGLFGGGTFGGANVTRILNNTVRNSTVTITGDDKSAIGTLCGMNQTALEAYNTNNVAENVTLVTD